MSNLSPHHINQFEKAFKAMLRFFDRFFEILYNQNRLDPATVRRIQNVCLESSSGDLECQIDSCRNLVELLSFVGSYDRLIREARQFDFVIQQSHEEKATFGSFLDSLRAFLVCAEGSVQSSREFMRALQYQLRRTQIEAEESHKRALRFMNEATELRNEIEDSKKLLVERSAYYETNLQNARTREFEAGRNSATETSQYLLQEKKANDRKIQLLNNRIESLQIELSQSNQDLDFSQSNIIQLQKELETARSFALQQGNNFDLRILAEDQVELLTKKLENATERIHYIEEDCENAEERAKRMRKELLDAIELAKLEEVKRQSVEERLNVMVDLREEQLLRANDLQHLLDDALGRITILENEAENSRTEQNDFFLKSQTELKQLRNKLQLEQEKRLNVEEELENQNMYIKKLEKALSIAEDEMSSMQSDLDRASETAKRLVVTENKLAKKQDEVSRLEAASVVAEKQASALRMQVDVAAASAAAAVTAAANSVAGTPLNLSRDGLLPFNNPSFLQSPAGTPHSQGSQPSELSSLLQQSNKTRDSTIYQLSESLKHAQLERDEYREKLNHTLEERDNEMEKVFKKRDLRVETDLHKTQKEMTFRDYKKRYLIDRQR
eukprot:g44.t1